MRTATDSRVVDQRLIRSHRAGDERARDTLIERYLPLARGLALRYRHSPEPVDDLVQVASLGLVKAVDGWDPDRGLAFSTYAVPTILGELRRYFRDLTWDVRPPRALQDLARVLERERAQLSAATGREPSVADLAGRLGRSAEEIADAVRAAEGRSARSLDKPVDDEDGSATAGELIGGDDHGYEHVEGRVTFQRLTARLDRRAREILSLRFEHDLRQRDIAARVGLSQMHVSRIISTSLDALAVPAQ